MKCRICGAELPAGAMFCGECGSSSSATPESRRRVDPRPGDTTILHRSPSGVVSVSVPSAAPEPAIAPAATPGATFTLRFSTGEVRTVFGTGLVGRNPLPQPGEVFDHLVQIADRTLSVSKTHLEFGQHDGELWVADRFSGNGTILRRGHDGAVRCEPGRRYLVPRGALVQLAEQSFVVG
ncbi:zinc ribbon domain-containing protein [Agromyces intestinalis]|uniref:Zinc ribbon domain-containing protein n=1 Tax=Agromyces intestinalis TaxID=2592652 RepID=A0A5C1YBG0_9MICO|nr:zinc-ribbon domain-containing protein [Agromyces intestinalis]QEO13414.1 zinc ribbon domain-containing protein [Agromyces intestinalis]